MNLIKSAEIAKLRSDNAALVKALQEINADIKPELCTSELELIVWWGRQVDRLQAIARKALRDDVSTPKDPS